MANQRISKKIQELIKTATPKQKAIIVSKDWTDMRQVRQEPLLTEEEVTAIRDSIKTPEEAKEYNKWITCYNVYADVIPLIGLALAQYREQAEEIVGYLRVLESYEQEENHLNSIFEALKESNSKKALSAFDSSLKNLRFQYAELKRDEEGYIEIDTSNLFSIVQDKVRAISFACMALKAFIIAVDNWTNKHKSRKLMPPTLYENMDAVKSDTLINVVPSYSRRFLKDKIAQAEKRGETYTPTISEKKKAIFPCYDEMPIDKEYIDMWTRKMNNIEASLKNG